MRRTLPTVILSLALLALLSAGAGAQTPDHVVDESAEPRFLFVISSASGTAGDGSLTLDGVPSVVYFSDRPARIAGHMSLEALAEAWDLDQDSFAAIPPNAALSILETGADVVVELMSLELTDDRLRFDVRVLDGTLPAGSFGPASLFIDEFINGGAWTGT